MFEGNIFDRSSWAEDVTQLAGLGFHPQHNLRSPRTPIRQEDQEAQSLDTKVEEFWLETMSQNKSK